ncbi:CDP-glycerol glycerophosphotransferase family protein [Demequina litorisediminis]|uniref:CDP-Glycerol:Poly(Glycerophosphate) glycerophosphotransferase n=1 Tax=Demequina litorisediminis TaxID=1849022 RepID=A0ABQ6IF87_9MICO|nr:CDP-glycerol glycerophosphotransferase family protein [Demequina litorisediminis]GMA36394.1 hypothetical protein GCM10025876_25980 [Demequina litorisediminis]
MRQWYGALGELDKFGGVSVITQDSRTARAVREETDFEVLVVARNRTFAGLVDRGNAKIAIYVGHANNNLVGLRATGLAHIFLAHGDSDKSVSVSNQVKGFDYTLVAGQAAVDRYAAEVLFFDADRHLRVIGRPQLPARVSRDGAIVVLYAPTWEGSQETNAYSSAVSHGEPLVGSLLDAGYTVLYRPHPRLGVSDKRFRAADQAVRALVTAAGERGRVDTSADPGPAMQEADVLITDVSAMSSDWLSQAQAAARHGPHGAAGAAGGTVAAARPGASHHGGAGGRCRGAGQGDGRRPRSPTSHSHPGRALPGWTRCGAGHGGVRDGMPRDRRRAGP